MSEKKQQPPRSASETTQQHAEWLSLLRGDASQRQFAEQLTRVLGHPVTQSAISRLEKLAQGESCQIRGDYSTIRSEVLEAAEHARAVPKFYSVVPGNEDSVGVYRRVVQKAWANAERALTFTAEIPVVVIPKPVRVRILKSHSYLTPEMQKGFLQMAENAQEVLLDNPKPFHSIMRVSEFLHLFRAGQYSFFTRGDVIELLETIRDLATRGFSLSLLPDRAPQAASGFELLIRGGALYLFEGPEQFMIRQTGFAVITYSESTAELDDLGEATRSVLAQAKPVSIQLLSELLDIAKRCDGHLPLEEYPSALTACFEPNQL